MTLQLREVQNRRDLRKFVRFPRLLYRENHYWVPPLYNGVMNTFDPDKNAAYEYSQSRQWLALRDGVPGRKGGGHPQ